MSVGTTATAERNELEVAFSSEAAFRAWYDHVLPHVYGYVLAHSAGQVDLAQDVTQQTFVDAVRGYRSFDQRADVVTWLCAIARRKLADHYRRLEREERRHLRLIVAEIATGGDEPAWRSSDRREEVEGVLGRLPAVQRAALLLAYVDGLSVREIASTLGRSEKATESVLSRARANFRRAWGGEIDD